MYYKLNEPDNCENKILWHGHMLHILWSIINQQLNISISKISIEIFLLSFYVQQFIDKMAFVFQVL